SPPGHPGRWHVLTLRTGYSCRSQIRLAILKQASLPGLVSVSPCSSETHYALSLGRDSQLLALAVPPLQRVLLLFSAFDVNAVSMS
ncbi:MAG: hypothetical protein MUO67_11815, partial [Anaerolineales bacterium]|nr:hypothetical protein [Anaerolineales bacterium]